MSEKRFRVRFEQEDGRGEIVNEKGVELTAREVVDLLNEQQATIEELERKVKKYAKIGEEQLKQIIELQDICRQSDGKMKQPTTINLTEEDEKELRKLLGLIDDEG